MKNSITTMISDEPFILKDNNHEESRRPFMWGSLPKVMNDKHRILYGFSLVIYKLDIFDIHGNQK